MPDDPVRATLDCPHRALADIENVNPTEGWFGGYW